MINEGFNHVLLEFVGAKRPACLLQKDQDNNEEGPMEITESVRYMLQWHQKPEGCMATENKAILHPHLNSRENLWKFEELAVPLFRDRSQKKKKRKDNFYAGITFYYEVKWSKKQYAMSETCEYICDTTLIYTKLHLL